ncbi:MAG: 50S ribosomal protein L29 [Clostridia bacterium]|nr:50S ribosomal protein L29 [Clostridia bacterium]
MKAKELRELTTEELVKKVEELKAELYNLRFASATGNLEKPSKIKEDRKTIARIKQVLTEREKENN